MDCSTKRMGSVPNLPVKRSISIHTMLNFDGDGHGHGDGDSTRKRTLILTSKRNVSSNDGLMLFFLTTVRLKSSRFECRSPRESATTAYGLHDPFVSVRFSHFGILATKQAWREWRLINTTAKCEIDKDNTLFGWSLVFIFCSNKF